MIYLELYYYLTHTGTGSFNEMLFELINKADSDNTERLRLAFPKHLQAWDDYQRHGLDWLCMNKGKI